MGNVNVDLGSEEYSETRGSCIRLPGYLVISTEDRAGRIQAAFRIFNICLGCPAHTKAPGGQSLSLSAVRLALYTRFSLLRHESSFLFLEISVSAFSADWVD